MIVSRPMQLNRTDVILRVIQGAVKKINARSLLILIGLILDELRRRSTERSTQYLREKFEVFVRTRRN